MELIAVLIRVKMEIQLSAQLTGKIGSRNDT